MHRKMNKLNPDMITCTNKFSTHLMNYTDIIIDTEQLVLIKSVGF